MKNRLAKIWVYSTILLMAGNACGNEKPLGHQVKPFSLKDFRGKSHSLADFDQHKVLVLAFLGTECPLAKLYGPRLNELSREFGDDVQVVGINANVQDSITEIAAYARIHELNFPILKDVGNRFADAVGAVRTPEVFVLDQQRTVRYWGRIDDQYGVGYVRDEPKQHDMREAIQALLEGKDVSVPVTQSVGCHIGRIKVPADNPQVTYTNQIARIFQKRCVECHREGDIAPFELADYDEVVGWAEMIAEVVRDRRMPPWHADPAHGTFDGDRSLSAEERELIFRWVADGAPEGDPTQLPQPKEFASDWQLPRQPDVVFNVSEKPFRVKAEGEVRYQWFSVKTNFEEDKWLQAAEILPGNRAVVHHILAFSRKPGSGRRGIGERDGYLVAYVPGLRARAFPPGMAKRIPAGSELVFQVHYTPIGSVQFDRSKIGLTFAKKEDVTHVVQTSHAINTSFEIPPHAGNHEVKATTPASPREVLLLSMMPHTHLRGKSFRYEAQYPSGETETLLNVPAYDFNWQTSYRLVKPKTLPKGTKIHCVAHYDNSGRNLANPDPSNVVRWGDQTWEEMMLGYFDIAMPILDGATLPNLFGRDGADSRAVAVALVETLDKDGDGRLAKEEVQRKHQVLFRFIDKDGDRFVSVDELEKWTRKRRN